MITKQRRAAAMSPADRRRAIVTAVIPLLTERGSAVTTRQMAKAAGIAEGTIFRVFPDKWALIHEAIKVTMDPVPVQKGLAEIYPSGSIEVQLGEAARILLERFEKVIALVSVLRTMPTAGRAVSASPPPFIAHSNAEVMASLTDMFERHRDRLRIAPSRAAAVFLGLIFASGHPMVIPGEKLTIDEIIGVLLSGVVDPVSERAN